MARWRSGTRRAGLKDTDQKLVLTAAFRVAEPAEAAADMGASLDEAADEAGEETPAYPHLRPVEDVAQDDAANGSGGSAGSGADILRQLAGSPDDTLFDRARQAMEAVRESGPVRPNVAQTPVEPAAEENVEPPKNAETPSLCRAVDAAEPVEEEG
ncbi:MAG: hypothetical protein GXP03_14310, partial [Alphaproteobacteria bacterium]|nr:hypothetical protein [Alphaproteobacteria bacterium]